MNLKLWHYTNSITIVRPHYKKIALDAAYINYTYLQDTCRMAAPEFRYGLEVKQTSVQKQTHLLCPFPFQS